MSLEVRGVLWSQLGGAIDMLENAIRACPPTLWGDRTREPEYWYIVYHTLFFLDYTLADSHEGFMPPEPYNLDELDPAGVLPARVYSQEEMLIYLEHCRHKCRLTLRALTPERAAAPSGSVRPGWTQLELRLSDLRHVQHHTEQLNLLLRQSVDSAPRWVSRAGTELAAV